ncbi:hypothetical protein EVG20_g11086 [Dentipellis fragilis]|uniref:Uncharacterized protein n=1 Tax=Dentipellis fragilis TaxID=205917 RepID=A0A4Y9XPE9_9AGAM|nr:hypothetical protein EVG20_g11086 [Dentipellis fragilis]
MDPNIIFIDDIEPTQPVDLSQWIRAGKVFNASPQSVRNALAERISLSADARALLPSNDTTISDFLEFRAPRLVKTLQIVSPASCFSDIQANKTVLSMLQDDVPLPAFVSALRSVAGQAILDGKVSIRDWRHSGIFLPLDAIGLWQDMAKIIEAQQAWVKACFWLEKQVQRNPALKDHQDRVERTLAHVPWNQVLGRLGNFISSSETAIILSNEWICDGLIDTMLTALATRLRSANPKRAGEVLLATHLLAEQIVGYEPVDSARLSNELQRCTQHLVKHPGRSNPHCRSF